MKYTLCKATETNRPHYGLMTEAFYVEDLKYPFPTYRVVIFNHHAPVTIEADVVEIKGTKFFCPKTKEGTYYMGHSPEQKYDRFVRGVAY